MTTFLASFVDLISQSVATTASFISVQKQGILIPRSHQVTWLTSFASSSTVAWVQRDHRQIPPSPLISQITSATHQ